MVTTSREVRHPTESEIGDVLVSLVGPAVLQATFGAPGLASSPAAEAGPDEAGQAPGSVATQASAPPARFSAVQPA